MDQLAGLLTDGGDDLGVAVAGGGDGDAGGKVEEGVAVDVFHTDAAAPLGDHGVGAGVGGGDVLVVLLDDAAGVGAGERGKEAGAVLGVEVLVLRLVRGGLVLDEAGHGVS